MVADNSSSIAGRKFAKGGAAIFVKTPRSVQCGLKQALVPHSFQAAMLGEHHLMDREAIRAIKPGRLLHLASWRSALRYLRLSFWTAAIFRAKSGLFAEMRMLPSGASVRYSAAPSSTLR